jgi:signal transduction histidine kinase
MTMNFKKKDDFDVLNAFAHDLKTPLGGIKNFTQMVEQSGELNPQQQIWLERIYKSVDRMLNLINDMMSAARIESAEVLNIKIVDLEESIKRALDMLDGLILAKNLTLSIEIDPEAKLIHADKLWLEHALLNIISNAVKYNKQDGQVTIRVGLVDAITHIQVIDTGMGIPQDSLPKLFDKFYRAKNSKGTEGTGLGLAIVKSVIDQHRGEILVDSEVNVGTSFLLKIPSMEGVTEVLPRLASSAEIERHSEEADAIDDASQEAREDTDTDSKRDFR